MTEPTRCLTCGLRKSTHPVEECVTGYVNTDTARFRALSVWYQQRGMEQDAVEALVAATLAVTRG